MIHLWTYSFLVLIIPLLLLLFILSKNLKTNARKFYFMSITSFVFWLLFNFLYVNAPSYHLATVYYSILLIFVSLAAGNLFLTAVNFRRETSPWNYLFSILPLVLLIFIVPCRVEQFNYGWQVLYNYKNFIWGLLILILVLSGVYVLLDLRKKIRSKNLKKRMSYLIASTFLSAISGVVVTPFTVFYNLPSLSGLLASLFVMLAYFAFRE